jgi:hypothetical protein
MPPTKREELSDPPVAEESSNSSRTAKAKRKKRSGEKRRSERVSVEIPVDVYARAENQEPIFGPGKTLDVSAHGALIDLPMLVEIGQTLRLVHRRTKREIVCQIVRFVRRSPGGGAEVGVEFAGVSPRFWALTSSPEDWDTDWVPKELPQHPELGVPGAKSLRKGAAGASPAYLGDAVKDVKRGLQRSRAHKWPVVVLAASVLLFTLWIAMRGSSDPDSAAGNAFPAGVAPEDARRIPRIERTRLAEAVDFDSDAVSWLRRAAQQPNGKIPGFYSGSKKSNAYILVGKANERHVVIFADGELRYNAEYPVLAIAACVPMEVAHQINWAEASTPESDGDGLLLVRAADAPASSVVLFLRGSQVVSASPVDYREVKFGQGCQP